MKSQRKLAREKATIAIYQHLLVEANYEEMIRYMLDDNKLSQDEEGLEYAKSIIENVLQNKEQYQGEIEKHIKKGWSWDRLGFMEKAILLVGSCEMLDLELDKKIAINEAVNAAKKYCSDDSYKLINGILGAVI